jgi:hypothetical protein
MPIIPVVQSNQPATGVSTSTLSQLGAFAGGAATGIAADQVGNTIMSSARNAKIGLVGSLVSIGMGLLTSNAAMPFANNAMTSSNAVSEAPGAFLTSDITNLKHACQQNAQAVQQLAWGGYTGLSTVTQPVSSPSLSVQPAPNSLGTAVVIGVALLAAVYALS